MHCAPTLEPQENNMVVYLIDSLISWKRVLARDGHMHILPKGVHPEQFRSTVYNYYNVYSHNTLQNIKNTLR